MSDSLTTYLHDHLTGANFGVELAEFLRDHHEGEALGTFAATLLAEIVEDRKVLQGIIDRSGSGIPVLKEAAGWVGQKLSHLKLRHDPFGNFEALEALTLGIFGKLSLWRALETIADTEPRVQGVDLKALIARAEAQHSKVEEQRLQAAPAGLARNAE